MRVCIYLESVKKCSKKNKNTKECKVKISYLDSRTLCSNTFSSRKTLCGQILEIKYVNIVYAQQLQMTITVVVQYRVFKTIISCAIEY